MTIAHASNGSSARESRGVIQWLSVQPGLWVGKISGEFAGMIERRGDRFAAIRLSELLGEFDSLTDAKDAFARA